MPSSDSATVFIVDDDSQMRKSLRRLLESAGFASEAFASAAEFLDRYNTARPGCLILDVRMPEMSGLELQSELAKSDLMLPIIIISGFADVPTAVQAVKLGAVDVLEKPFDDERLLTRVRRAIDDDRAARQARAERSQAHARVTSLTTREREVMELLAAGLSTKQIARDLGISTKTADAHRAKVLAKLGVENVVQLANLRHRFAQIMSASAPVDDAAPAPSGGAVRDTR